MFKNDINSIPWDRIATAHGNAAHVPDALVGLASADENICHAAYWQLDNHVVLQSDLYPAAYYIIKFLIEMLGMEYTDKNRIYNLITEISLGYAPSDVVCETYEGRIEPLMPACRSEVRKGIDIYLSDANSYNDAISSLATELMDIISQH